MTRDPQQEMGAKFYKERKHKQLVSSLQSFKRRGLGFRKSNFVVKS